MHYLQWFVKSPNWIQWKNYKRNTCFHTVEKCLKIHFALRCFLMTLFWSAYQMSFTNKQKIRRYQYLLWYELYPGVPVLNSLYHEIGKCSKIHMGDPLCPELQWKHRHSKLVHFAFQIWSLSIYLLILHTLLCLIDVARRLLFHSLFAELRHLMRAFCTLGRLLGTKKFVNKN